MQNKLGNTLNGQENYLINLIKTVLSEKNENKGGSECEKLQLKVLKFKS